MAQRDRSQGFGFVYVDIARLLTQRDELTRRDFTTLPQEGVQTVNFNKDPLLAAPSPRPETPGTPPVPPPAGSEQESSSAPDSTRERTSAINQIRQNLDRLQSLHHKLHAMLEELNSITDRDKKRR